MILISLNKFISLLFFLIISLSISPLIRRRRNRLFGIRKRKKNPSSNQNINNNDETNATPEVIISNQENSNIEIESEISKVSKEDIKIFGIYDPAENDFELNMWSATEPEDIRSSIKRINKIELSNTASKLFEYTILSFAYPPKGDG